jgi:hypothetical protein
MEQCSIRVHGKVRASSLLKLFGTKRVQPGSQSSSESDVQDKEFKPVKEKFMSGSKNGCIEFHER